MAFINPWPISSEQAIMRSHLTPRVFRAILDNRPYIQCRRRLPALLFPYKESHVQGIQRRRIFSLSNLFQGDKLGFRGQSDTEGDAEIFPDSGAGPMVDLVRALQEQSRPPPPLGLAKSFKSFIVSRIDKPQPLTYPQIQFLFLTFQHLIRLPTEDAPFIAAALEPGRVEEALIVLSQQNIAPEGRKLAGEFARLLFQQFGTKPFLHDVLPSLEATVAYISVLASSGSPSEALDIIDLYWSRGLSAAGALPWVEVLRKLPSRDSEPLVPKIMEMMTDFGVSMDQKTHEEVTLSLATENNPLVLRTLYEMQITGGVQPSTLAIVTAIKAAARNSMLDWASLLVKLLPNRASTEALEAILLVSMLQGVDFDTLQATLEESLTSDNSELRSNLTIDFLNTLIEHAIATQRLSLVGKFVSLAKLWNLTPDARTCMLQLDTRLRMGDTNGALSLFQQLNPDEPLNQRDAPILNAFIAKLCSPDQPQVDYNVILSLVDKLSELKVGFDAEPVRALCNLLLYRRDFGGVSTLLRPLVGSYSHAELSRIQDAFICYISDKIEPTESVWEAYELMNVAFPNTPTAIRTKLMTIFFERERSDLACVVFGHMRQKYNVECRPDSDAYALCFQGLARSVDRDGLNLVHNMLKLDLELRLTTRVFNGLMLAYAACGVPLQSMILFRQILHSAEGPSGETLIIFFRVCETLLTGVEEATKMIKMLKSHDIAVDAAVYDAYIAALGSHCQLERAVEAVSAMENVTGEPPSAFTLGSLYNAIPYPYWKGLAEEWIRTDYPSLWDELERKGLTEDEDGILAFDIDRSISV